MNSLRMEKAYRHWGHDICDEDTPIDAGLMFVVKPDKAGGFIGRDALMRQSEIPRRRALVQFKLNDSAPLIHHNEPIWRNTEIVGQITSGMYGHTLGAAIGLGYVHDEAGVTEELVNEGGFEIEVAGERYPAKASMRPMYDPENLRIRC